MGGLGGCQGPADFDRPSRQLQSSQNYFHVGLPPQMRNALEADEKQLKLNRRDYLNQLRYARVQALEKKSQTRSKR